MVILESGCHPVEVQATIRAINYLLKLVYTISIPRLAIQVYRQMHQDGNNTWLSEIRQVLSDNQCNVFWLSQSIDNHSRFMNDFKKSCLINHLSNLFQKCFDSSKGELFSLLCASMDAMTPAWHLRELNMEQAAVLTRFRLANHSLPIETGRWNGTPRSERLCQHCGVLGDEHHHVFVCDLFSDLRVNMQPLLGQYTHMEPNIALAELLECKDKVTLYRLAKFLKLSEKRTQDNDNGNSTPGLIQSSSKELCSIFHQR